MTNEKDCMDTYYCWWEYVDWNNVSAGGTCKDPNDFGGENLEIIEILIDEQYTYAWETAERKILYDDFHILGIIVRKHLLYLFSI